MNLCLRLKGRRTWLTIKAVFTRGTRHKQLSELQMTNHGRLAFFSLLHRAHMDLAYRYFRVVLPRL